MNSEITDGKNRKAWRCFEVECGLGPNCARCLGPLLRRHRFGRVPLAWKGGRP